MVLLAALGKLEKSLLREQVKPPMNVIVRIIVTLSLLLPFINVAGQAVHRTNNIQIISIMNSIIAPASDQLWAAENPITNEDWAKLENATKELIDAAKLISNSNGEWMKYNQLMIKASNEALSAVWSQNIEKLYEANENLYLSCVECHNNFHSNL